MSDKIFAVAVDGPSGAGKSTLAKAVAAELGIVYVDTGAIYRSIGCYMHDHQIDPHDAQAVAAALPQVRIQIRYGADGLQRMILNDEDVTDRIRLPEMSKFASAVSAIPAVRWICSATWPNSTASSWTGATSVRSSSRTRT